MITLQKIWKEIKPFFEQFRGELEFIKKYYCDHPRDLIRYVKPSVAVVYSVPVTTVVWSLLTFRTTSLESTMLLSASITTILSMVMLPQRYSQFRTLIGVIYSALVLVTIIFVKTSNIVTLFVCYELFLLPSAALVWLLSPTKRGKKACLFFIIWTQLGSLMVLVGVLYIRVYLGIYSFYQLKAETISMPWFIETSLLLGFLFKVPTFPFYFWLTKTHVEAPTSFSIFLSGFLVKIAIFGLYKFLPFFSDSSILLGIVLALLGSIVTSITFLFHVDIKKLVAYATVQEMGVLTALLLITQTVNVGAVSILLITHTLLSTFYFSISDVLYKKLSTRSYLATTGLIYTAPKIAGYIATSILFFRGIPLTAKFPAEVALLDSLALVDLYVLVYLALFILFIGNLLFSMAFKRLLVGSPTEDSNFYDLTKEEFGVLSSTLLILILIPLIVL